MKTKEVLLIVIALGISTLQVFAQSSVPQPPVSVQSPNTASFALYGEVPVSYFTGVPEISIPLYNLKEKEITLPLSLNYHASGIRPDVHPGWVGNGWSFSNPGVITRTVHGSPDDYNVLDMSVSNNPLVGFEWNNGVLNVNNWSSTTYMQNIASTKYMYYTLDNEPDELSFNFGKYSGKFYIDANTGNFKCTDRRLKVAYINDGVPMQCPFPVPPLSAMPAYTTSYPSSFPGFIVTTEDGTQYVFGGTTDAIEYSISFFAQNTDYWLANSWYLTKIIGPDGSQINFTYTRGPMINQMYISLYERAFDVSANPGAPFLTQTCGSTSGLIPVTGPYDGKLISPIYLKEIDSEHSKIMFNISPTTELIFPIQNYENYLANIHDQYSTHSQNVCFLYGNYGQDYPRGGYPDVLSNSLQWEKLDNIQVYSTSNNQLLKQYNFTYSSDANQRLTLLSAQETDGAGETLPPYTFNYDTSTPLPGYASASVDNWGFSNGQASDVYTVLAAGGGANNLFSARQANPFYLRAGVLNKIVYPTGGTTTFTYEPNTYSQEVNVPIWQPLVPDAQDLTAGGLRIQNITSVDPNLPNQTLTKQYYYYKNYSPTTGLTGRSSGVLGLKPQYLWPTYTIHNGNNSTTAVISVFSWQSVLPATENTAGTHIGYSEVEELDQDGSIIDYKFTNYDNGHLDLPYVNNLQDNASAYVPYNSRQLERGKLIGKNIYNATGKLLDATTYNYQAFGNGSDSVRAVKASIVFLCNNLAGNEYSEATAYYNYTYPYLESQITNMRYDQNGLNPVTTVTNFSYETLHGLLRQKSFTNSKGQTINSKYLYPFDVVPSSVDQTVLTTKPVSYMVNNNIIGQPLQVVNSKVTNGAEQIVSASITNYKGINVTPPSGTPQVTVKPNYNYQLEFVQPPLASSLTNYAVTYSGNNEIEQIDSRFIKHRQFVNYDLRGNIAQYNGNVTTSTSQANTSYGWGYNGLVPVIEIKNAASNEFYFNSFEEDQTGVAPTGSMTTHTGHKYSTSNSVLWTPPATGRTYVLSYWYYLSGVWKYSGEIPYTGTSYSLNTGSAASSTAYDDIRIYPKDAMMTTYTYDLLVGMTSSTDAKGEVTYYEYDGFQRLQNIKDKDGNIIKHMDYHYQGQ